MLFAGVERMQDDSNNVWLQATPLKALADYVYLHHLEWTSSEPLIESLWIDKGSLSEITRFNFLELEGNYTNRRVNRFLAGLKKELFL